MDFFVPPFEERFPWWGGDLQTIATQILPAPQPLRTTPMRFPVDSDNTLVGALDSPDNRPDGTPPPRPLVVLIHGVPGAEDSRYMLRMSKHLVQRGHRVLRLNLRGAGPSRSSCKGQYYAGSSEDLRALIPQLPASLTGHGVVAVGYSIGGAVLLKYLGEEGSKAGITAAASVSAPLDLAETCATLMRPRNALYHFALLRGIKQNALGAGDGLTERERGYIETSQTLWQYDDIFTAPRNGFAGAADYYAQCSAVNFLSRIRVPTLVLAALDDPWVPGGIYSAYDWASVDSLPLTPLLMQRGGHVGFHGRDMRRPLSDFAVIEFFAKATGRPSGADS